MSSLVAFNTLLIPIDFSDTSREAFLQAEALLAGEEPSLIALHVIDTGLVDLLQASGVEDVEQQVATLRKNLEQKLTEFTALERSDVVISRVICVGTPFLEILHKATDFAVDAIVMGKVGNGDRFEQLLFGSTAEHVLRASACPVIVFPRPLPGH
ncbi:MAG: universal stress protein [Planctomycetales bacterium]|nr:universal stress protein [Planctomycetales bacterium]